MGQLYILYTYSYANKPYYLYKHWYKHFIIITGDWNTLKYEMISAIGNWLYGESVSVTECI